MNSNRSMVYSRCSYIRIGRFNIQERIKKAIKRHAQIIIHTCSQTSYLTKEISGTFIELRDKNKTIQQIVEQLNRALAIIDKYCSNKIHNLLNNINSKIRQMSRSCKTRDAHKTGDLQITCQFK